MATDYLKGRRPNRTPMPGRLRRRITPVGQLQQGYYAMSADIDRSHGRRARYIFYEEACRVPFLVRWPGWIRPGATDHF